MGEDWGRFYSALVTIFNVPAHRAWDMTTTEFWLLYAFKFEESSGNKQKVKPLLRTRFEEMVAASEARKQRKKDGVQ